MVTQADIGSCQLVNSPKFSIGAHQTRARADTADRNNNIAISDNLILRKIYVEIGGVRYPRDSVPASFERND